MPKQNLTQLSLKSLLKRPGRHNDGGGLYFRVIGKGKAYFVFRYRLAGRERETSLGPYPELGLEEARQKHAALRKQVKVDKIDPLADRRSSKTIQPSGKPTFGQCADARIAAHEGSWRSSKHARQWSSTLTVHAAAIRDVAVDQITTEHVLAVLRPIWNVTPETASRLRARIEVVLASAQVAGHIDPDKPNPARWKGWLDHMLANPKKVGKPRGHHAAMPYTSVPAFMAKLAEIDSIAARALMITILTVGRTSEVLGMTFGEINFDTATWVVPKERMKMGKEHAVPLSDPALAILRAQEAVGRGSNPYVFAGRPMKPLSGMSMSMLLRRMKINATVHGMRSAARSWMADNAVPFELAEACLAHTVGNAVVQAYQRSSMLERRRPIMAAWANYVTGQADDNVVPFKQAAR
jgi:integrase